MPALPVRSVLTSGLAGASVSALALAGSLGTDTLPAASVALTVTLPSGISTVGVIVALPFSSATENPYSWINSSNCFLSHSLYILNPTIDISRFLNLLCFSSFHKKVGANKVPLGFNTLYISFIALSGSGII